MNVHIFSCTASAPASVGNVAVGFDILGHAFDAVRDTVQAIRTDAGGLQVNCSGPGTPDIPLEVSSNTAGRAAQAVLQRAGLDWGVTLNLHKGIPLSAGMGGSGASAVAAAVAVNGLLESGLSREDLLDCALEGEAVATGSRVIDNVAASLLGGLVFARDGDPPMARGISVPPGLFCALVYPELAINTATSRAGLSHQVDRQVMVAQTANLAGVLLGCQQQDMDLLARFLRDVLIEPQRAPQVPGFAQVQARALAAGALGCSLSGSGPSLFAWCRGERKAHEVAHAMAEAFSELDIVGRQWVAPVAGKGAEIVERI